MTSAKRQWDHGMYHLSKFWNRMAFMLIHLGTRMLWDYTKLNREIIQADLDEGLTYLEDILTKVHPTPVRHEDDLPTWLVILMIWAGLTVAVITVAQWLV